MRNIWLLFLGLIVLVSCGKKPVSEFTADKSEVTVGEAVTFTNTATDAYYYHWKFGDGSSSREANPVHIFDKAGNYDVMLHVSNKGGDNWNTSSQPVTVYGYNSAFIGTWAMAELDSTENCGNANHNYTLTIRRGNHEDEMIIENLGDLFNVQITGYAVYGDLNKLEMNQSNALNKAGESYNVNGSLVLNGTLLTLNYQLNPSSASICGYVRGYGAGIKY
jgi:PKD repeat protein